MPRTAVLIGSPPALEQLERQLDLLEDRPATLGWIVVIDDERTPTTGHVLGQRDDLEAIIAEHRPDLALIALPAVLSDLVRSLRTRLRRLGVADRFMPTLHDQLAGVGPRSEIDIEPTALLDRSPRIIDPEAAHQVIRSKRVLITGAGGSIGSELARLVAAGEPAELALMERSENALFEIDRQIARLHPSLARGAWLQDVVDDERTLESCRRFEPHIIFHAAAHKHVPLMEDHPAAAVDNNVFGTKSIADAADEVGVERFVMISTDKAVNPTSIMGATKRLAETYVQALSGRSRTAFSVVRFGNVLGSSGSVLEIWSRQIADGGPVTVTDPRMTRYFMTIPEAATLVIESAALVEPGTGTAEIYLLDMGEPVHILGLARRFIAMHGLTGAAPGERPRGHPGVIPIVYTGPRPGEKLHEQLSRGAEQTRATSHPAINVWRPPPLERGSVEAALEALDPGHRVPDPRAMVRIIRSLVPEMTHPVAA